jgi:hypothetical protein
VQHSSASHTRLIGFPLKTGEASQNVTSRAFEGAPRPHCRALADLWGVNQANPVLSEWASS